MAADQFRKGLTNVIDAINAALAERHVDGATVQHDARDGIRQSVTVRVNLGDKSESEVFEPAQLDDCGQAIDAPAAVKVRMLVSHFVS